MHHSHMTAREAQKHANPLHGDNHNSHPLEDGGAAARERQKPAARAVMTDRASIL